MWILWINCKYKKRKKKCFVFDLNEVHEIVRLFAEVFEIKAKRESWKFNSVIGFFRDGPQKSQYLLVFAEH